MQNERGWNFDQSGMLIINRDRRAALAVTRQPSVRDYLIIKLMQGPVVWCYFIRLAHLWAYSPDIPSTRWQLSQLRCRLCCLQGLQRHQVYTLV